jgi:hypothetical protein
MAVTVASSLLLLFVLFPLRCTGQLELAGTPTVLGIGPGLLGVLIMLMLCILLCLCGCLSESKGFDYSYICIYIYIYMYATFYH